MSVQFAGICAVVTSSTKECIQPLKKAIEEGQTEAHTQDILYQLQNQDLKVLNFNLPFNTCMYLYATELRVTDFMFKRLSVTQILEMCC
jgi:hypothetical protein